MASIESLPVAVPNELAEAIRAFPSQRIVEHCGTNWSVSPFDIYTSCPQCGAKIKLRAFSACGEIEDLFDAVFEWMNQPGVEELVRQRRQAIAEDA